MSISALQKARAEYKPVLPLSLANGAKVKVVEGKSTESVSDQAKIKELFKSTYGMPQLTFDKADSVADYPVMNVGVILSGGQAPGGHNVIAGLYDGLKSLNKDNKLFGFLGGPSGYVDNSYIELTDDIIDAYRNTGGFDIIGSGRTKLETEEQFLQGAENCKELGVGAVVIIGGDDSNTNACLLAEYYKSNSIPIQVIGCPKTIDGDLKNEQIEISFGFDTACKVYSELIGNIMRDCNSSKKYWHFIRLMGRSASHISLECALQTHANVCLIGEEIRANNQSLTDVVEDLVRVIVKRAEAGINFGVILVPEGVIEFIPEVGVLIGELNELLHNREQEFNSLETTQEKINFVSANLSEATATVYNALPALIQAQLTNDRDPHGNVQVSLIETEKLLLEMVEVRLKQLKSSGKYKGKFGKQTHFFGYEGRCAAPSNFDANYCYALGYAASALIGAGKTGYMSSVQNLVEKSEDWVAGGVPITMMMNIERRHGADKPVIRKALVDLTGKPFTYYKSVRGKWGFNTDFVYPGPIQYFGPSEVCDLSTETLKLESTK
jgi:pyrophosphate--fructose-6-phosphate 1-phosphotransferase